MDIYIKSENMKKIIRLTESELRQIVEKSVNRILREDVLGNDWRESDEVMNNYEPFDTQHTPFNGMSNEHDWGVKGEPEGGDPTHYDNFSDDIDDYAEDRIDLQANYDDFPPMG